METTDKQFILTFTGITGLLVIIAVIVLVAANMLSSVDGPKEKSKAQIRIAKERIKPVGQVSLASNPAKAAKTSATVASATAKPASSATADIGKQVYSGICQSCHTAGIAGAPIVGDIATWQPRIANGIDTLYASAINGIGIMAAKGGNPALSDDEVKKAVDYMVKASQ